MKTPSPHLHLPPDLIRFAVIRLDTVTNLFKAEIGGEVIQSLFFFGGGGVFSVVPFSDEKTDTHLRLTVALFSACGGSGIDNDCVSAAMFDYISEGAALDREAFLANTDVDKEKLATTEQVLAKELSACGATEAELSELMSVTGG